MTRAITAVLIAQGVRWERPPAGTMARGLVAITPSRALAIGLVVLVVALLALGIRRRVRTRRRA